MTLLFPWMHLFVHTSRQLSFSPTLLKWGTKLMITFTFYLPRKKGFWLFNLGTKVMRILHTHPHSIARLLVEFYGSTWDWITWPGTKDGWGVYTIFVFHVCYLVSMLRVWECMGGMKPNIRSAVMCVWGHPHSFGLSSTWDWVTN